MKLRLIMLAAVAGVAALAFGSASQAAPTAGSEVTLNVDVGVGTGTTAGNVFAPGTVTINTGDTIIFEIASDEPHTVTFGEGPAGVPPPNWESTFGNEESPEPIELGPVSYDGTDFVHTGVIFTTSTLEMTFEEEGTFPFICAIHPGMAGEVTVDDAEDRTTQAEADAAADETRVSILAEVPGIKAATAGRVTTTANADGTSRHNIFAAALGEVGPQPGGGSGYMEIYDFTPSPLNIRAGDTVHWQFPSPHTVTFTAPGQDPTTLDPFGEPAAKPSPAYNPSLTFNSGLLALGPGAPADFELTFPTAGSFNYVCLLHQFLGQTGTINVAAGASIPPPQVPAPGGAPGGVIAPNTGDGSSYAGSPGALLPLLALVVFAGTVAAGTGLLLARRRA